ncbi:hypothetical protein FACS189472_17490 [Alphaproteobacteria bacterium]|nr:hypothetical protein FACS189472_17490 [Alphaproteobacteria bacterium]
MRKNEREVERQRKRLRKEREGRELKMKEEEQKREQRLREEMQIRERQEREEAQRESIRQPSLEELIQSLALTHAEQMAREETQKQAQTLTQKLIHTLYQDGKGKENDTDDSKLMIFIKSMLESINEIEDRQELMNEELAEIKSEINDVQYRFKLMEEIDEKLEERDEIISDKLEEISEKVDKIYARNYVKQGGETQRSMQSSATSEEQNNMMTGMQYSREMLLRDLVK